MTMQNSGRVKALGMMSGTSLDGVDVCLVDTDGEQEVAVLGRYYRQYPSRLRERLLEVSRGDIPLADVLRLERDVTEQYALALLESNLLEQADVVGCHGQTVRHMPTEGLTWQLGDPNYLAERITGVKPVPVVMDFRRRDMAAGGEGAPLAPLFHAVMLGKRAKVACLLNIGGVANVTVVHPDGRVLASDCGPGMGMLDTWMQEQAGAEFDKDGAAARQGIVQQELVARALTEIGFFSRPVPCSADRYEFYGMFDWMKGLNVADGAATLGALTVAGIDRTLRAFGVAPDEVEGLYVSGGGSYNPVVMEGLADHGWQVADSTALGWEPLAVEAACFGWLAVRRLRGLPTAQPSTTHCTHPTVGGVLTV